MHIQHSSNTITVQHSRCCTVKYLKMQNFPVQISSLLVILGLRGGEWWRLLSQNNNDFYFFFFVSSTWWWCPNSLDIRSIQRNEIKTRKREEENDQKVNNKNLGYIKKKQREQVHSPFLLGFRDSPTSQIPSQLMLFEVVERLCLRLVYEVSPSFLKRYKKRRRKKIVKIFLGRILT